VQPK
jgi:RND family efflux transporter MFP subunit